MCMEVRTLIVKYSSKGRWWGNGDTLQRRRCLQVVRLTPHSTLGLIIGLGLAYTRLGSPHTLRRSIGLPGVLRVEDDEFLWRVSARKLLGLLLEIDGGQKDYSNSGGLRAMYIVQ